MTHPFPTARHARHQIHMDVMAIQNGGIGVDPLSASELLDLELRIESLRRAIQEYRHMTLRFGGTQSYGGTD